MPDDKVSEQVRKQFAAEVAALRDMSATSSDPLIVAKAIAGSDGGVQEVVLARLDAGEKLAEVFALQGSCTSEMQVFFRFTPANEVARFMDTGVLAFVDSMKGAVTGVVDPYTMQAERRVGRPFLAVSALKDALANTDGPSMQSIADRETKFFSALNLAQLIIGGGPVHRGPTETACSTGILSTTWSGQPYRPDKTDQETTYEACDSIA